MASYGRSAIFSGIVGLVYVEVMLNYVLHPECALILGCVLLDDAGIWDNHDNTPEVMKFCMPQRKGHRGQSLSSACGHGETEDANGFHAYRPARSENRSTRLVYEGPACRSGNTVDLFVNVLIDPTPQLAHRRLKTPDTGS